MILHPIISLGMPYPSPQLIGEPFKVTITAQDAANNTLDYRLPVTLSALIAGNAPGTNTILNSPSPEQSLTDGTEYVLGYSFTPSNKPEGDSCPALFRGQGFHLDRQRTASCFPECRQRAGHLGGHSFAGAPGASCWRHLPVHGA